MTQADSEHDSDHAAPSEPLPAGNLLEVLLEQHAAVRELFTMVREADDGRRQQWFDELRQLLAVHETGEQKVLWPVVREVVEDEGVAARVREESAVAEAIAVLETDVDGPGFDVAFAELERLVIDHIEGEERLEFKVLLAERGPEVLEELGRLLVAGQSTASARQQSGQGGVGARSPFRDLLAQAREAFAEDWPAPLRDGTDRTLTGVDTRVDAGVDTGVDG